jgi:mono/diheme cytochrome c family protein
LGAEAQREGGSRTGETIVKKRGFIVSCGLFVCAVLASAQTQRTIWDGVYSEEQAKRGEQLYAEHCARCHGDGLGGVESAPALTGPAFYATWEGESLNALFERIRMSMPQDNPGSLSRAQNADIVSHMLRAGGYPAGKAALEGQAGTLGQIKVLTYKP